MLDALFHCGNSSGKPEEAFGIDLGNDDDDVDDGSDGDGITGKKTTKWFACTSIFMVNINHQQNRRSCTKSYNVQVETIKYKG